MRAFSEKLFSLAIHHNAKQCFLVWIPPYIHHICASVQEEIYKPPWISSYTVISTPRQIKSDLAIKLCTGTMSTSSLWVSNGTPHSHLSEYTIALIAVEADDDKKEDERVHSTTLLSRLSFIHKILFTPFHFLFDAAVDAWYSMNSRKYIWQLHLNVVYIQHIPTPSSLSCSHRFSSVFLSHMQNYQT